jgi:hypothetical protein
MDAATDQPSGVAYPMAFARRLRSTVGDVAVVFGAAVAAGYAIQARSSLAVPLLGAAVAAGILAFPPLAAAALGVTLPATFDLAGGRLGVRIAASDIVLVFLAVRVLGDGVVLRTMPALQALRPVRLLMLQYSGVLGLLVVLHAGSASIVGTAQRFELFLVPLVIGAFLALRRDHMHLLRAYVIATSALAVAWPLNLFDLQKNLQKNPTGQFFANAILLLVAVPGLRRFLPCLPLLVFGLFETGSRGAILALLIGIAAIACVERGRNLRLVLARVVPLLLIAVIAFHWLPSGTRARVTNFTASEGTSAGYSVYVRDRYQQDAERIITAHPWAGIGVGSYLAGDPKVGTATTDPHQVVLLEAADGGFALAAAFLVLVIGSIAALVRMRAIELAPAALGVIVATVGHGMVDVYWVRGTPVLSWLLVGIVCGLAFDRRTEPTA